MKQIQPPTHCPSCGSKLEWTNHLLYCRSSSCSSKVEKRIQHFAKTLKIKGLGPVTIAKLNLADVTELYLLTEETIAKALNSERLAEKLMYELENSKKAPLNLVLPAFSIPLVGKTAAEKLSMTCESINDIRDDTCRRAGLGPKVTENLLDWIEFEYPLLKDLPFDFKFHKTKPVEVKGTVCISGRLKSCGTKALATAWLELAGYAVKSNFTKDVTILVNESGIESAKTKRARETGVTIVTNLKDFIGEN